MKLGMQVISWVYCIIPTTTAGASVPNLMWHSIAWFDSNVHMTEPGLAKDLPTDQMSNIMKSGAFPNGIIPEADIPCHTQAVESHIKQVKEASIVR